MAAKHGEEAAVGGVKIEFTAEEEAELRAHPIGSIDRLLTGDRLALRKSIARKQWEAVMDTEWYRQRPAEVRAAYEAKPPWKFYMEYSDRGTPNESSRARRLFGVMEYPPTDPNPIRYHTIGAMFMSVSKTIGGISSTLPNLEAVDNWNEDAAFMISTSSDTRSMFFDPFGWWEICMGHDEDAPQTCACCGGCEHSGALS